LIGRPHRCQTLPARGCASQSRTDPAIDGLTFVRPIPNLSSVRRRH
jgi:hypothetical protein